VKADTTWLARVHAACFNRPRPWSSEEFAELLQPANTILITRDQGFVLARTAHDEAEILTIAVMPSVRRRGIGRNLLLGLERGLGAKNIRHLFLEVSAANTAALALYYSLGFVESGRRSGYYPTAAATAQDALILSKTLG